MTSDGSKKKQKKNKIFKYWRLQEFFGKNYEKGKKLNHMMIVLRMKQILIGLTWTIVVFGCGKYKYGP